MQRLRQVVHVKEGSAAVQLLPDEEPVEDAPAGVPEGMAAHRWSQQGDDAVAPRERGEPMGNYVDIILTCSIVEYREGEKDDD